MGNSEVGHLNLGAGAVVKQDLMRIDDAIESGAFFENEALRAACHAGPAAAPARPGLRRRRALGLGAPARLHRARRARGGRGPGAARLHRRARHPAGLRRRLRGRGGGLAAASTAAGWRPSAGATTRWTATAAGSAPSSPSTRSCTAQAEHRAATRRGGGARRPTSAARPTSSSSRRWWAEEGRIRPGDSVLFFNFRPDRARQLTQMLDERLEVALDDPHAVPRGLEPTRWPSRPSARPPRSPRCWPSAGSSSCTWPRPRSTPT